MTLFEVQENNYSVGALIEGVQQVHLHDSDFEILVGLQPLSPTHSYGL